ncbi:MAG: response regulator [Planctomycetota bacterium]|nr:response regulator [Planctomycetaceae bacterium]MDQ3332991.1 response regulator [Planctomycetota bacterium]
MTSRILICDDEFPITKAVGMKLTKCGFDVQTCHDGQAAWEAYCAARPDMLVTDLQMPRLDGLSLIRLIREGDSRLPVVLLTAKGFEINEAALEAEFGRFRLFAKPFSPRELAGAVADMLQDAAVAESVAVATTHGTIASL